MLKIEIKVHPGAKQNKIQENPWEVWITAPADKGKANKAVIDVLSKAFSLPKSKIRIVSGLKSRRKVVELDI